MSTTKNYGFEVIPEITEMKFGDFRAVLAGDIDSNFTKLDKILASVDITSMTVSSGTLYLNKKNGEKLQVALPSTGSGDSVEEVFIATRSTTFNDLEEAIAQGKVCYYKDSDYFYSLLQVSSQNIKFGFVDSGTFRMAQCNSESEWTFSSNSIQLTTWKKNSIDSTATNSYYPSCKAVYDFVTGLIGSFETVAANIDEIIGG